MNFILIRNAIISTLGAGAGGQYRTIGYQRRSDDEKEIQDNSRAVQVYYSAGNFDKHSGSIAGPMNHDMTFALALHVSQAATVDLSTLTNPALSNAARAAAWVAKLDAEYLADRYMDAFWDKIFQVIMSASVYDFGLAFPIANKWLDGFKKSEPVIDGQLVILSATATLTCKIEETVTGDVGLPIDDLTMVFNLERETAGTEGAGIKVL